MMHVGDILSAVGVFSTVGDIMSTVGDTILVIEYRGGYHKYCEGCSVPWGYSNNKRFFPYGTEHSHGTHDIPPRAS